MSPLMLVHVVTGMIAVFAGAVALASRKGARCHRSAGLVFVAMMGVSTLAGTVIAFTIPDQFIAMLAGILALYLLATSVVAARRADKTTGLLEGIAFFIMVLMAGVFAGLGLNALTDGDGSFRGYPAEDYFFLSVIAAVAALSDLTVVLRKGVAGAQRVARHLWRMCFAFFIAAGSFFTGPGAGFFPDAIRESGILSLPEALIALLMIGYLIKVLLWDRRKSADPTA